MRPINIRGDFGSGYRWKMDRMDIQQRAREREEPRYMKSETGKWTGRVRRHMAHYDGGRDGWRGEGEGRGRRQRTTHTRSYLHKGPPTGAAAARAKGQE